MVSGKWPFTEPVNVAANGVPGSGKCSFARDFWEKRFFRSFCRYGWNPLLFADDGAGFALEGVVPSGGVLARCNQSSIKSVGCVMARKTLIAALVLLAAATARVSEAQLTLQAFTSFGGDGWLSPAEAGGTLAAANQVRSLAFDPSTSTLLIPSGANTIQRINATTGAYQGTTFNNTGVTGGAIGINTVAATSDGVVYASNLTTNSTSSAFKIYRWTSDSSAPTVSYSGDGGVAGVRVGDDIAVTGSDASGILGFGYATTSNGFATVTTGETGTATGVQFASPSVPAVGQFRLGMAFVSPSSVIGTQNSAILANATFSGAIASLASSVTLTDVGAQRGVGYSVIEGLPVLATIDTGSNSVRLFDATDLAAPSLMSTLNLTTGTPAANVNGTAQVVFGSVGGQPVLFALNSNNGIQAFAVVPEPGSLTMVFAAAGLGLAGLRRTANYGRRK